MNRQIRIIKLAERERQAEAQIAEQLASASHLAREETSNDAAATIMGWMGELQRQKQNSAGAAHNFKNLFENSGVVVESSSGD